MAEQEIKRQTAYKCTIATLNKGVFVKKQGWESNYLMTEYGDFSRVNIIAVVVNKDNNGLTLDDGTSQTSGRLFERIDQLEKISVGSVVLIIGRPREFNNKIYLTLEIIKNIDPNWITYRKKELSLFKKIREMEDLPKVERKTLEPEIIVSTGTLSSKEKITKLIKELDRGEGASIDDVMRLSKVANGEELISDMMMRGEIYEAKAGHIKTM
jgi:RPA family protein